MFASPSLVPNRVSDSYLYKWTQATGQQRKEDGKPCVKLRKQEFSQNSTSFEEIFS